MRLDDLLAVGETYPVSFVLFVGMQPLEDVKDSLEVRRADPDSVVGNGKSPTLGDLLRADLDAWPRAFPSELDRVDDEVLKHLADFDLVHIQIGRASCRERV